MNLNSQRIMGRKRQTVQYDINQQLNDNEQSQSLSNDNDSDQSYCEIKNEQIKKEKPMKMFENIQWQNTALEKLKEVTNNYDLKYEQIKESEALTQAPLKFIKKKDLQYLIRLHRQKLNRTKKSAKDENLNNDEQKILGKRILKYDKFITKKTRVQLNDTKQTTGNNQGKEQQLALLLIQSYHQLDKLSQHKITLILNDFLHKEQEVLDKIIKKQIQVNLKQALQLYEHNQKYELELYLQSLHPITVMQIHIQISLTNNNFTEEGNTLSKTLLPALNQTFDYNFIQSQDKFILSRFLNSLVKHICDTGSHAEKGFIIFGISIDPTLIQNINFIDSKNKQQLFFAFQDYGFHKDAALLLTENPQKFLWPELIAYLKQQSKDNIIEKLQVIGKFKIYRDPGKQLIVLDNIFDQRRLLLDLLLKTQDIQISLEESILIMENLKQLKSNNITQCLIKDSKQWKQQSLQLLNLVINDEKQIDEIKIKDIIKENLKNVKNPVSLQEMIQVSQLISKECPSYQQSNYQCAIASIIASFENQVVIVIMPTGSGKTWVEALISKYYCLRNQKVVLLEPNESLQVQTAEKIGPIDYSLDINTISQYYQYQAKEHIIICNEFDEICINSHYDIFQDYIAGLWNFKGCKKIIGFTATSNQALERYVNNVIGPPLILKFKSEYEIQEGISPVSDGRIFTFPDLDKLIAQFKQDLTKMYDSKPLVIIHDKEQLDQIQNIFKGNNFRVLKGGTLQNIETIKQWDYGILLLQSQEARGLDTKFSTDSIVLILAKVDDQLQYQQMIGRSSRTRGICEGYLYIISEEKPSEIQQRLQRQNFQAFQQLEMVHKVIQQARSNENIIEVLTKAKKDGIVLKKLQQIQEKMRPKKYQQLIKGIQF